MKFCIFWDVLLFLQSIYTCGLYIYIFYIFLKYNALYSGVYYYSFKACLNESKMFAFANGLINNQACFEKSYIYIYI